MSQKQKECPSCALMTEADAEVCPYCGYEFPRLKARHKAFAVLFIVLMVVWALWELA